MKGMTREEAIAQLKRDRDLCNFNPMTGEEEPMNEDCRKSAEALGMAIKALEQQPEIIHCKECKFYTEMRQDLNTGICSLACRHLGGDGFCSEAERFRRLNAPS